MGTAQPTQPKPAASVVIPCRDAAATLGEQLEALGRQDFAGAFEVVLVDNGSTDNSVGIARGFEGRPGGLRIVSATGRKGAGYARNLGVEAARSEKILFCDADDVVSDGWVRAMVEALGKHRFVAGGRDFQRLSPEWHKRHHIEALGGDEASVCDLHYIGKQGVPNVGAGNIGMHRQLFLDLGGFDVDLPFHEDVDLCVRAYRAGVSLHPCPEALAYIRVRGDNRSVFSQGRRWGYWGVALWKKHRAFLGKPPFLRPLVGWPLLFLRIVTIRDRGDFLNWLYRLGWKTGRLYGSILLRFPAL
jgi:glycosyltransferase involved in cell wall biosynthesis